MNARESRPALLCIHGISDTARAWDRVTEHLAAHYKLLTPTLPGHLGGPPLAAGEVAISDLTDSLENVLDDSATPSAQVPGFGDVGGEQAGHALTRTVGPNACANPSVIAFSPAFAAA
jgi:pimeloyl-ACP methyl ester carboxylesterase